MATFDKFRSVYTHDELMERLRGIRHVALDMDGTIYMGMSLFPYTKPFLEGLKELGIGYSFLTNNPSKSIADYLHKLETLGIRATREEMYTTALAIGIHNFPEGIATFTSAVDNMALGVAIAVAIAIHNIPEGIAVSIPIFYATGDRKKAFKLSLLSGLAEPVGALLAYLVLMPFMSPTLMGCILAGVAGIMVFISIDELLPAAREYGEAHISIYGVVAGMALMAVSLILLA